MLGENVLERCCAKSIFFIDHGSDTRILQETHQADIIFTELGRERETTACPDGVRTMIYQSFHDLERLSQLNGGTSMARTPCIRIRTRLLQQPQNDCWTFGVTGP